MRTLHVSSTQIYSGGGIDDILERVERQVKSAAAVGVEVLLFAEAAMHGYDSHMSGDTLKTLAEPVNGANCQKISALAENHNMAILIGFFENDDGEFYNSHLVATPDGKRRVQRKHMLTRDELAMGLTKGPAERTVFEFNGVKAAILICADTSIENRHKILHEQGVEYQFIPAGGGGNIADYLHERDLVDDKVRDTYIAKRPDVFKAEAIVSEEECPYIGYTAANALGRAGETVCHQGHCMIVDNNRVLRAQISGTLILEHQQDQMIHAELNFA